MYGKATIGDNHCCALDTPARDQHGRIDPDQRTAALLDLYQATTAAEIARAPVPAPVPPPTGLLAWLLDRDERVRRLLWVLYPAYGVAVVALLVVGHTAVTLPAGVTETALLGVAASVATWRARITRSRRRGETQ